MATTVLGTCSICRGPVTTDGVMYGLRLRVASCAACGAEGDPAMPYGPVIPMQRPAALDGPAGPAAPSSAVDQAFARARARHGI